MGFQVKKRIVLCADDFAQSGQISLGILQLLEAGRLSAVSCMTDSPRWPQDAEELRSHADRADIGLHFNLTHSFGQPVWPLPLLMQAAWRKRPGQSLLKETLERQLDKFESVSGRAPDFVDGHQHVHAFPWIRTAVLDTLTARYGNRRPYLRRVHPGLANHDAPVKAAVLRCLAWGAARKAKEAGFPVPRGFGGLYSLSPHADYARHMHNWLTSLPGGSVIMCHPALESDGRNDPIAPARFREFVYLKGERFDEALEAAGARLSRFRDDDNPDNGESE